MSDEADCVYCGVAKRFHWGDAMKCPGLRRATVWTPAPKAPLAKIESGAAPREEKP